MSSFVFDASTVLAYLLGEKGADAAFAAMPGGCISVVNVAEVSSKLSDEGVPDDEARLSLAELGLEAVGLDEELALIAGRWRRTTRHLGLSIGDRCCLATALRMDWTALTADRAWLKLKLGVKIECIR